MKRRTVIKRADDELVVYDQIHAAVVSDRDVTIRIRRSPTDTAGSRCVRVGQRARAAAGRGLRAAAGGARHWRIEPAAEGGSNLAYRCYSEPGGAIPAFLVRGAQQDSTLDEFERVLTRVGR